MTPVQKFWKDLEAYGLVKDSNFILNVPLRLLEEIFDEAQHFYYESNSVKPNLSEIPISSKTEISDEEIEKFADEELGTIRTDFDFGVIQGMKWYREQLKQL